MEDDMYWEMDRQHEEEEAERKRRKEQSRKKTTKSSVSAQTLRGKLKIDAPSAGSLQATRLAIDTVDAHQATAFLASYNKIIKINATMPTDPTIEHFADDQIVENQIPVTMPFEVQSLKVHNNILAAVDSYSNVLLYNIQNSTSHTFRAATQCESSWAGLTFNPQQSTKFAVTHMMDKSVYIYDNNALSQKIGCIHYPTNFDYITIPESSEPLLAVTEYNQLAIWDLRANTCVKRINAAPANTFYTVACQKDFIAVAGAARNMYVYDTKKWTLVGTWTNCSKYEVIFVEFSKVNTNLCYVGGLDSGLVCGEWRVNSSGNTAHSYLGDSRWLGLQKYEHSETLMGYTAQGNLYVLRYNEDQMKEATSKKQVSAPARSPSDEEKHKKPKQNQ